MTGQESMLIFLVGIVVLAVVFFAGLARGSGKTTVGGSAAVRDSPIADTGKQVLNCRVWLGRHRNGNGDGEVFEVQVCGQVGVDHLVRQGGRGSAGLSAASSSAQGLPEVPLAADKTRGPDGNGEIDVEVTITDVTEGLVRAKPILSTTEQFQKDRMGQFCYRARRGGPAALSGWVSVACIPVEYLCLPYKGLRKLLFTTRLCRDGDEPAETSVTVEYDNFYSGYVDRQRNCERSKRLGVAVALAVSAADGQPCESGVELVKQWAQEHIAGQASGNERSSRWAEIDEAIEQAVRFFCKGNRIDTAGVCRELAGIATAAQRYEILELCLRVVSADGLAGAAELNMAAEIAGWLGVDEQRFRAMLEKIVPVSMYECEDAALALGVSAQMSDEAVRRRLNSEYRKWNARVTHCDAEVRAQAGYMLKLIAQTRNDYIG